MSSADFDKEALANLTDEERAAIEDQEFSPEELAAMKTVAGTDDDGEEDDDKGDGEETPAAAAAAPAAVPEKKAEPVADPLAAAADDDKDAEFKPRYQAKLPEDYDAQVAAVKDETRALAQKFKEGDLDFDEYSTQLDEINARRDGLAEIRVKASIADDMNTQTVEQQWKFTIDRFTKAIARDEKIDYRKDEEKQADLDSFVKTLAANPKNADKDFDWFLNEAHKRVKALHGIGTAAPVVKADPVTPAKPSRPAPTAAVPATLAQVPGGDGVGDVGGEFADLDSLEGLDYEQAIAKMTPVQRERFLQGK